MEPGHLDIPHGALPRYLRDLRLPTTKDEALAHAESLGAPDAFLDFMEALPAAVFDTPEGMQHVFSSLGDGELGGWAGFDAVAAEDGEPG
jgi:hypothetical protein